MRRREFIRRSALAAATGSLIGCRRSQPLAPLTPTVPPTSGAPPVFEISLAEWSLNRALFAGDIDPLDFPSIARQQFGLDAVEYVNVFIGGGNPDESFLVDLKRRADDAGVRSLLIMVDREGALGDPDDAERTKSVENHHKWIHAAGTLGCHSVRVNAASAGTPDQQRDLAVDGLRRLTEYAAGHGLNVIVENHGGLSSNGAWLASVIRKVDHPNCGTLPDFGNFRIADDDWYDRYQGVRELMPFAMAVSAKSHDFDDEGNETHTDYTRMMRIVLDAGYRGYVGIEYEGETLPEIEGIIATRTLLERVRGELQTEYAVQKRS